jgi:membrane protein DedA with SNARE-associated domain
MESVAELALRFLDEHAHLALFVWLLLEEGGLPMPLPGDLVVLGAGARLAQGQLHGPGVVLLLELATLLGSTLLFALARRGGRPLLLRFGPYLHLDATRLAHFESYLQRRGFRAVVVGRLTPGLRVPMTLAAGALGVPYREFLPAALVGSNNLPLLALGYFAGPQVLSALQELRLSARLVGVLASLALVGGGLWWLRRRAHLTAAWTLPPGERLEVGLQAGAVATAGTVALLNVVLYGGGLLGQASPADALVVLGRGVVSRLGTEALAGVLIGGSLAYLALHLLWAVVYAELAPRLPRPDWLGGLLFALLPLTISLLVWLPLLGAGLAGGGLGSGWLPLAGEVLRHALFGWLLSSTFTLLSRARRPARRAQDPPLPQAA